MHGLQPQLATVKHHHSLNSRIRSNYVDLQLHSEEACKHGWCESRCAEPELACKALCGSGCETLTDAIILCDDAVIIRGDKRSNKHSTIPFAAGSRRLQRLGTMVRHIHPMRAC